MRIIISLIALIVGISIAYAQAPAKLCYPTGTGMSCQDVTSTNPLPTTSSPYAALSKSISGITTAIVSATNTSVIGTQGAGVKIYMTGFSCSNSGSTTSLVTFTDGSGGTSLWTATNVAGTGVNMTLTPPVSTAAAGTLWVTTGSASTSQICSATGFAGP